MNKYKLVALDLDGTLLNNAGELSETNRYWIREAEKAGIIVSLATGRGRRMSERFWNAVSPTAPMVVANGAEVWKNHEEVLSRHIMPPNMVPKLLGLAKEHGAGSWTIGNYIGSDSVEGDDCLKVGMHHDDPKILSKLRDTVKSWGQFEVSGSASTNIEINLKGVSKAAGLAEVATTLGIKPNEIVAVGDSFNDLAMITWVGFGVAMQNAEEIVKKTADYITASNEEDGVAQVIKLLLK